jgi:hypothetical protein
MTRSDDLRNKPQALEELGQLASALCEGHITLDQARRLEQLAAASDEARRYFVQYVQLHGELYWDAALSARADELAGVESALQAAQACSRPSSPLADKRKRKARPATRRVGLLATVASVVALLVVMAGLSVLRHRGKDARPVAAPLADARLTAVTDVRWPSQHASIAVGSALSAGRKIELAQGLAEIAFASGARVILEGPASLELTAGNAGILHAGKLAAQVPPRAAGFTVHTPSTTIVDLGTEFGLSVALDGASQVHVFTGSVEVRPGATPQTRTTSRRLAAGEAVAIHLTAGGVAVVERIAMRSDDFARSIGAVAASVPSVANFRGLVARHPRLIHQYTFEGTSRKEKMLDFRDDLHLNEAVMLGGRGRAKVDYSAPGFDPTSEAVAFTRAETSGNTSGVGLQSGVAFYPADDLTVELLLKFDYPPDVAEEGFYSAAVATRADQRDCGFFVMVGRGGRLVHLLDGDADWVETGVQLVSGDWYYLAVTFRARADRTTIDTYLANLTDEKPVLRQVVRGQVAPGRPAASRLGIGKGFDEVVAHAYPWSGAIDEVALYDAVLDPDTIQGHLAALVGGSSPPAP